MHIITYMSVFRISYTVDELYYIGYVILCVDILLPFATVCLQTGLSMITCVRCKYLMYGGHNFVVISCSLCPISLRPS